jgi:hypothetical protein
MRARNALISACAVNQPGGNVHLSERVAENSVCAAQGGAVGERGSSVRRLRAGRRVGTQGLRPPGWSVADRRPGLADGYPGVAAVGRFGRGAVPRVISSSCWRLAVPRLR